MGYATKITAGGTCLKKARTFRVNERLVEAVKGELQVGRTLSPGMAKLLFGVDLDSVTVTAESHTAQKCRPESITNFLEASQFMQRDEDHFGEAPTEVDMGTLSIGGPSASVGRRLARLMSC